jgi:hypothetical protein
MSTGQAVGNILGFDASLTGENGVLAHAKACSDKIHAMELKQVTDTLEKQRLLELKEGVVAGTFLEVCDELDEAGKRKFTNDLTRKAEAERRLACNFQHANATKEIAALDLAILTRRADIDRLHREHHMATLAYEGLVIGRRK